jgi:methylmalonyl-CoA/ethylmalonyl-CoA epimerase
MHFTHRYGAQILNARISKTLVRERGGLHVRYAIARIGQEHFMWAQPLAENLREILDSSGEGMIYRHGYSTPDIEKAYDELMVAGGRFGHFSIEILEEKALEAFIEDAFT